MGESQGHLYQSRAKRFKLDNPVSPNACVHGNHLGKLLKSTQKPGAPQPENVVIWVNKQTNNNLEDCDRHQVLRITDTNHVRHSPHYLFHQYYSCIDVIIIMANTEMLLTATNKEVVTIVIWFHSFVEHME